MTDTQSLDDLRVATVNEHMRLENAYDFPGCIGKFGKPKYQLVADGELYDGTDRVHYFLSQNHTAFPDFVFEPTRVSPTTNAVVVEGHFVGTHLGPWRGLPASGKKVDFEMCLIFEFDGESMTNEKLYFDLSTPLRQLGIADDYNSLRGKLTAAINHPVVIIKALIFSLTHRGRRNGAKPAS
ncbi:MAG TPA: ester cyclase [Actinocrinis sp.]|uniref:ester cyclase n=1 Tax=Actinocrinis sp. TaxID=1920516 RepID=UPI002DDD5EE0|nr:ester cyclase [Actinocrinis sp.]HEV2344914.1 ester cyclase [Actinocrinis sp.]